MFFKNNSKTKLYFIFEKKKILISLLWLHKTCQTVINSQLKNYIESHNVSPPFVL